MICLAFDDELPAKLMVTGSMLYYRGITGTTDVTNNIQAIGVTSFTDCYRVCLMINNRLCNIFRYY